MRLARCARVPLRVGGGRRGRRPGAAAAPDRSPGSLAAPAPREGLCHPACPGGARRTDLTGGELNSDPGHDPTPADTLFALVWKTEAEVRAVGCFVSCFVSCFV